MRTLLERAFEDAVVLYILLIIAYSRAVIFVGSLIQFAVNIIEAFLIFIGLVLTILLIAVLFPFVLVINIIVGGLKR